MDSYLLERLFPAIRSLIQPLPALSGMNRDASGHWNEIWPKSTAKLGQLAIQFYV